MSIMPLTRQLGEILDAKPIPELEPIAGPVRPTRRDCWTPEAWAEMQEIYAKSEAGRRWVETGRS